MERVYDLAAKQYALASREQILALGVTVARLDNEIRSGRLEVVRREVYGVRGCPQSWEREVMARVLAAGRGAGASLYTAAALRNVRSFYRGGPIYVSRPWKQSRKAHFPGLHESLYLPDHHLTVVRHIPTTTAERLMFDLAPRLDDERRLRVFNDILSADLATLGSMEVMFAETARRGRWGSAVMRELLSTKGEGYVPTESELEDLALTVIDEAGIRVPRRQATVGGTTAPIGRIDFLFDWTRPKLVLEADSLRFHKFASVTLSDQHRTLLLIAAGFDILRVNWWQLTNEPDLFIAALCVKLGLAA